MNRSVVNLLRIFLVVLVLGGLGVQLLIPVLAVDVGHQNPEVAHLVVPYCAAAIAAVACVQVALVAVWRLLTLVADDVIFSPRSLRWVDTIIWCAAVATVLSAAVLVDLVLIEQTGGPGPFLALVGCTVAGMALVLLMAVMRGLLQAATADRRELAEVI